MEKIYIDKCLETHKTAKILLEMLKSLILIIINIFMDKIRSIENLLLQYFHRKIDVNASNTSKCSFHQALERG